MALHRVTRRTVLGLSAAVGAGLAGCPARPSDSGRQNTPSPTATERGYSHTVDSPESVVVRDPEGSPAVRSSARSPEEDGFESSAAWDYEDWLVTSPGDRDALSFSGEASGVENAREFVADTDLSETTLLVHQYDVGQCVTRRLGRLKWDTEFSCGSRECTGIYLEYERAERDGDCEGSGSGSGDGDGGGHGDGDGNADGPPYEGPHANEATFVRVPARIQSYGRFSTQV